MLSSIDPTLLPMDLFEDLIYFIRNYTLMSLKKYLTLYIPGLNYTNLKLMNKYTSPGIQVLYKRSLDTTSVTWLNVCAMWYKPVYVRSMRSC